MFEGQTTTEATIKGGLPVEIVATLRDGEVTIDEINWTGGKAIPAHMEAALTGTDWDGLYEAAGYALRFH